LANHPEGTDRSIWTAVRKISFMNYICLKELGLTHFSEYSQPL
jgi:hypothetical protein